MQTIDIQTGRPYQVMVGQNILADTGRLVRNLDSQHYQRAAIITDDIVNGLYGDTVRASLEEAGLTASLFAFPNGEASKHMGTLTDALAFLSESEITRTDLVVALGGGVVGDLAGFAASIHLRGVDYIQVPTTLLAAMDSSVGGKTAVNTPAGKNLAGTFWQPRLVVCDYRTMDTLSDDIFGDGVAETIKHGCIWDEDLFALLETHNIKDRLEESIIRSVSIKAAVVGEDERETGLRQILNFGHTVGHAVEKLSGLTLTHGKGVSIGMRLVAAAGESAGITPRGTAERIAQVLKRHGLPTQCDYTPTQLAKACLGDKKRLGNTINFILLQQIGKALLHPVPIGEVEGFLAAAAGEVD